MYDRGHECFVWLLTIIGRVSWGSDVPLFKQLKILPIQQVYVYNIAQFMYKYLIKMLPETFSIFFTTTDTTSQYSTRNITPFKLPRYRLVVRENSMSVTGPKVWNHLCNEIRLDDIKVVFTDPGNRAFFIEKQKLNYLASVKKGLKVYLNNSRYYP